jgi:hypothetical protein
MACIEIRGLILGDHALIDLQHIKVLASDPRSDLKPHMKQLAEMAVVRIRARVVPECGNEFLC